jgi:hypothetical protein
MVLQFKAGPNKKLQRQRLLQCDGRIRPHQLQQETGFRYPAASFVTLLQSRRKCKPRSSVRAFQLPTHLLSLCALSRQGSGSPGPPALVASHNPPYSLATPCAVASKSGSATVQLRMDAEQRLDSNLKCLSGSFGVHVLLAPSSPLAAYASSRFLKV